MLTIKPMQDYTAPEIPTQVEANTTPTLLQKLPHRWRKHAAVVACAGFAFALTGCQTHHGGDGGGVPYVGQHTEQDISPPSPPPLPLPFIYTQVVEQDLVFRIHVGGTGFATYVAHLTEQEAFSIIRLQLEKAGLRFGDTPPPYIAPRPPQEDMPPNPLFFPISPVSLDLYDRTSGVAIAHLSNAQTYPRFSPVRGGLADVLTAEFSAQNRDMVFGVFYNAMESLSAVRDWGTWEELPEPTAEEIEARRPGLHDRLHDQIDAFIALLQAEGIL